MLKRDFNLKDLRQRFDFFREMNNFADFLDGIKQDFPDYDDYDNSSHHGMNVRGKSMQSIGTIIAREDGEPDKGVKDGSGKGKGKGAAGSVDSDVSYTSSRSDNMFDLGIYEERSIQKALRRRGISVLLVHSNVSTVFCRVCCRPQSVDLVISAPHDRFREQDGQKWVLC
jgi:hypothetical protein